MYSLLVLTLGCSKLAEQVPSFSSSGPEASSVTPAESQFETDLAPGVDLAIRVRGPEDSLPEALVVSSRSPMFGAAEVGSAPPEGTVLEISPAVEGSLTVQDRWTLVFRPTVPFKPNTPYTVTLKSVVSKDADVKPLKPPEGPGWSHQFRTPEFLFLGAKMVAWEKKQRMVQVALSWAGAPADLPSEVKLTLDGIPSTGTVSPGSNPYEVIVKIVDPIFGQEAPVPVQLQIKVPEVGHSGGNARAPRVNAALTLEFGQHPMDIKVVRVREGANGFYLDVICDDGAVPEKTWWYDRQSWDEYKVSTRCVLDADMLKSAVHFSPAVENLSMAPGEAGFRIFGDFTPGTKYQATLDGGAVTEDGGSLVRRYETELDVPHRTPKLQFASSGRYLPRSAWRNLPVVHTNVERVRLRVRHIPESNLVFWMSGQERADERSSNVVLDTELPMAAPLDTTTTSFVDVASLVPDAGNGVYELQLIKVNPSKPSSEEEEAEEENEDTGRRVPSSDDWQRASAEATARLLRTDMHLLAKTSGTGPKDKVTPGVDVWAINVHDNQPIGGVDIKLVRPSGFVLGTCSTGSDGHCKVEVKQDEADTTSPMAVVAKKGNDLTYLKFADLQIPIEGDVGGLPYQTEQPYRAAPYLDRGVYRPGDTAHLSAVVRDEQNSAPAESVPVMALLRDPQGKIVRQKVLNANAAGLLTWDMPFSDAATTGRWSVSLEVAKRPIGSLSFQVEEFVPERMRASAKAKKAAYLPTDAMDVQVEAAWLFGAPADGSRYQLDCRVEPRPFDPPGLEGFRFGPASLDGDDNSRLLSLGQVDGELDMLGQGTLSCPTTRALAGLATPSVLVAQTSVFEGDSGRSTVATAEVRVHPEKFYIGLKTTAERAESGTPVHFEGKVVDWEGKPAGGQKTLAVQVLQLQEESVWTWDAERYRSTYRRYLRRAKESEQEVVSAADGSFSLDLTPGNRGSGWLVVVDSGKAHTEYYLPGGMRWWWWDFDMSVDETPRPEAPKSLVVQLPDSVKVGDKVPVKINAPFAGRVLYTVETDSVQQYAWKDVKPGENTWEFTVSSFAPNLYVGALLVKDPHMESAQAFLPDRAFGVKSVRVEPTAFTSELKLLVPAEIRPYSPLKVDLDLGPTTEPTWVTVAAVDEGILSLTKFQDPDPNKDLFARRALGVSGYETIGWTLLFAPGSSGKQTGGDAAGAGGRVQMVKPVALWSGPVQVGPDGKASVSLDVPGYRGELRVMAVATGRSKVGRASAKVKVREPLVLQTTLPRFLLMGDEADVPVRITNMSGSPQNVTVKVEVEGIAGAKNPVEITGGGSLKLGKDEGGSVYFHMKGLSATGGARLRVVAKAGNLESHEELEIPLQPPRPPSREIRRVPLPAGVTNLKDQLSAFIPGTDSTSFWVTTNPYAPAMKRMEYLIHYPYGCIEQTSSSTRPLLYIGELMDSVRPEKKDKLEDLVQHGIERLLSMQTPSGGFSYWPGGSDPAAWGSAYATHTLLDAKKAGYPVNEEALADALSYLERVTESNSLAGTSESAYAHYVLALGGKGRPAQAAAMLDKVGTAWYWGNETRMVLKAAMYLGGDRRYQAELRTADTSPILMRRYNGWNFYSDLRERGMRLAMFRDIFGDDPAGDAMADAVGSALMRLPDWGYTTQELAWAITGLGKSVGKVPNGFKAPVVTRDGAAVKPTQSKGNNATYQVERGSSANDLTMQVNDNLGGKLYLVSTMEGSLKVDDRPTGGEGLQITRSYHRPDGEPLNGQPRLGDLIYVKLELTNTTGMSMDNIALVDRVPAGWEIENPRLGRGGMPDWQEPEELWAVDHMNVRDDRVELFGTVQSRGTVDVVYQVRAVTAGTFVLPGATAEAMYDPEIWARLGNGSAVVLPLRD
jgi:alpha-2-macroglobulin